MKNTDPSGHSPISLSQVLSSVLSPYIRSSGGINILTYIADCSQTELKQEIQYDLTGYLALAMSKHGRDPRVKFVKDTISLGERLSSAGIMLGGYLLFNELEGKGKVWDIKINIRRELDKNIVLCGTGINCKWFDYSTPGNIHFGYIAGLAKIDHYIAAIAGGWAEQTDLQNDAEKEGRLFDWKDCFKTNFPKLDACDNPQDQAAVDFGYALAKNPKYKNGISDQEIRNELQANGMNNFQTNPHRYDEYWYQVYPQQNHYGADHFNQ
ncbi:MAG TPA: polymorphic toxin type 44 domain-containing protein [Anaerolineales bacterium]|nr:polymorphic toxin type 44 domain-containing protein [Anaerolineales bacterium]HRK88967.1 polymorphic toxin type 44 domain-containing protein [Anaerolineales bacterium]